MSATKEAGQVLGLEPGAKQEDVERAYHRQVRRYPPEFHPERFAAVHRAYRLLISLERRMSEAREDPESALDDLFPPPAIAVRPPEEPPVSEASLEDLEPLLGPLRRDLLVRLLRGPR